MKKGFIQIPILLAIMIGIIAVGSSGYFIGKSKLNPTQQPVLSSEEETNSSIDLSNNANTTDVITKEEGVEPRKITAQIPDTTKEKGGAPKLPEVKNFKDFLVSSINSQIDSYKSINNWIDTDMLPLLSQRESVLNNLISETVGIKISESDSSITAGYDVFIKAYQWDLTNIVGFYRNDMFGEIKKHISNEKIPALNNLLSKYVSKSFVSEDEYISEIQQLSQYEKDWQSIYDVSKKATSKYIEQVGERDSLYQKLWSQFTYSVSDLKKIQTLEVKMNQLYSQPQIRPISCSFSAHFNGFSTIGSLNCY